jgi:hypothetical protein
MVYFCTWFTVFTLERRSDRDRSRDRAGGSRRDDGGKERGGRRDKSSKDDEEQEIAEANALRAKLGMAPLQR